MRVRLMVWDRTISRLKIRMDIRWLDVQGRLSLSGIAKVIIKPLVLTLRPEDQPHAAPDHLRWVKNTLTSTKPPWSGSTYYPSHFPKLGKPRLPQPCCIEKLISPTSNNRPKRCPPLPTPHQNVFHWQNVRWRRCE